MLTPLHVQPQVLAAVLLHQVDPPKLVREDVDEPWTTPTGTHDLQPGDLAQCVQDVVQVARAVGRPPQPLGYEAGLRRSALPNDRAA